MAALIFLSTSCPGVTAGFAGAEFEAVLQNLYFKAGRMVTSWKLC